MTPGGPRPGRSIQGGQQPNTSIGGALTERDNEI
jgi:hypothetical protein